MAGPDKREAQGGAAAHARHPPGTPDYEAASRFDEAFADWLQNGTPGNMIAHHGQAAAQLELALGGAAFQV